MAILEREPTPMTCTECTVALVALDATKRSSRSFQRRAGHRPSQPHVATWGSPPARVLNETHSDAPRQVRTSPCHPQDRLSAQHRGNLVDDGLLKLIKTGEKRLKTARN